jgi:hypothetical protein
VQWWKSLAWMAFAICRTLRSRTVGGIPNLGILSHRNDSYQSTASAMPYVAKPVRLQPLRCTAAKAAPQEFAAPAKRCLDASPFLRPIG